MLRFAYPLALAASTQVAAAAGAFELSLPIDCEPGKTCLVQNLVDIDAGRGRADAFCGAATYDGHKGTDFRVVDLAAMKKGVDVLAAAPGRVTALRDGEPDALKADRNAAQGRECGNGVLIAHGDGWVTQYCHLARDSIKVAEGMQVKRGQPIGRVGLSGMTQFPHVHLSVRRKNIPIDPATGRAPAETDVKQCASKGSEDTLWDEKAAAALRTDRHAILAVGFAAGKVAGDDILRSRVKSPGPTGALVFYAQVMNVRRGDVLSIEIVDGDGRVVISKPRPLAKNQATHTAFVGKSRMQPGRYQGRVTLMRDGRALATRTATWVRD